jgi:AMIN domain
MLLRLLFLQDLLKFLSARLCGVRTIALAVGAVVLGTTAGSTIGASVAQAAAIDGWSYDPASGQLRFELVDGVKPRHFLMAQPARIVVDLLNTQVGNALAEQRFTSGPVQKITVDQLQPQLVRVTLFMSPDAVFLKGQVAIDRVGDGVRSLSDVWSIRPLVVGMPGGTSPATIVNPVPGNSNPIVPPPPNPVTNPIVSPPAPSELPGRFNGASVPAVVPGASELPPGMSSVLLSSRSKPEALSIPEVKPQIQPEVKPEIKPQIKPVVNPPKLEAVSEVIPIAVPQFALAKPSPKPVPAVPSQSIAPVIAPVKVDVTAMAMPPMEVPKLEIALPNPPKVEEPKGMVVSGMPMPDALPAIVPGAGSGAPTVSVPGLETIPATNAGIVTPMAPRSLPNGRRVMPSVMPSVTPQVQRTSSEAFPLPDRIPSIVQNVTPVQPQVQPQIIPIETYRPAGSGIQPVDRQAIANNPTSVIPGVIEFGQPLGGFANGPSGVGTGSVNSLPPGITPGGTVGLTTGGSGLGSGSMLPMGTVLQVRYTGISSVQVKQGEARQEMVVLQTAIRDRSGAVIAPEGTTIYGRFDGANQRFVANAIAVQGQLVALMAESGDLGGGRNPKQGSLLQNSGLGALAGVIVGGLSGGNFIGGAAAGAAITYATTPKVTAVQPGQVLEIRLTQDWVLPGGVADGRSIGEVRG